MLHSDFNRQLRSLPSHAAIMPYQSLVSAFAFRELCASYTATDKLSSPVPGVADGVFHFGQSVITSASDCTCSKFTNFRLPCKHIFSVRRQLSLPVFDSGLVHRRWCAHDEYTASDEQHVVDVHADAAIPCGRTRGQRFKALMAVFTSMASTLADLPPARFRTCLQWVSNMEASVRNGTWKDALPAANSQEVCANIEETLSFTTLDNSYLFQTNIDNKHSKVL